jgi:hypothetical protein
MPSRARPVRIVLRLGDDTFEALLANHPKQRFAIVEALAPPPAQVEAG